MTGLDFVCMGGGGGTLEILSLNNFLSNHEHIFSGLSWRIPLILNACTHHISP